MKFPKVTALLVLGAMLLLGVAIHRSFDPNKPEIHYTEEVNFGIREYGEIATQQLFISNTRDQSLLLEDFQYDCSCSGLEIEEAGQFKPIDRLLIAPKAKVSLFTRLSIRGKPGDPEKHAIHFRTNDPRHPKGKITLLVPLVQGVAFSPTGLVFGEILSGHQSTQQLTLHYTGAGSIIIEQVRSSNPTILSAELLHPDARQKKQDCKVSNLVGQIRVGCSPELLGPINETVTVFFRLQDHLLNASVPVSGYCVAPITLHPSRVILPRRSDKGQVFSANVLCRSSSGRPLSVIVQNSPKDVTVTPVKGTNASVTLLRVEWNPPENPSRQAENSAVQTVELLAECEGKRIVLELTVECSLPEIAP